MLSKKKQADLTVHRNGFRFVRQRVGDEMKKAFHALCACTIMNTHIHTHIGAFVAVEFTRGTRYANEAVCLI